MNHTKSSLLGGLIKKTSLALIAGAFVLRINNNAIVDL